MARAAARAPRMRVYHASPGFGSRLDEAQAVEFLEKSVLNLQLGTVDADGEANIHTVWYVHENGRLYIDAARASKKVANIRRNPRVYFCVDDEKTPYRGVRGKGTATIHEDVSVALPIAERIMLKYTGSLDNDIAAALLDGVRAGKSALVEIEPLYYSTWDHASGVTGGRSP